MGLVGAADKTRRADALLERAAIELRTQREAQKAAQVGAIPRPASRESIDEVGIVEVELPDALAKPYAGHAKQA